MKKTLAALLALILLLGLIPAATMEDYGEEVVSAALEAEVPEAEGIGAEGLFAEGEAVELPAELEEQAPDYLLDVPDEASFAVSATSDESLVRITRPANGDTVPTGEVALWCTFINPTPSSFDVKDAWKYLPMRVQVMKNGGIVSDENVQFNYLCFTSEGQRYASVYLMEAGTYTIRVSVPGSEGVWDSITVTAQGASITPEPIATREPVTDETLAVIDAPVHGSTVNYESIPFYIHLRRPASGAWSYDLYSPLKVEVLGSRGQVVWSTDIEMDADEIAEKVTSGESWMIDKSGLDVGGNYTFRVKPACSSTWDSVEVFVEGPTYPQAKEYEGYACTPKQDTVTIDLAENPTARFEYTLRSSLDPLGNHTFYCDYVEDGSDTIKYKDMSGNTLVKSGNIWTCDGWIEYTGQKVGTTTLHMYILVNAQRYDHHAITVNVIDSSKVVVETPTPTATPKPTAKPSASVEPAATAKPTAKPTVAPTAKPKSIKKAAVTLKTTSYTYNGKAREPAVTVKLGTKTLKKGRDYKVTYSDNKAVGTATATVEGINKYTGTARASFKINPKAVTQLKLKAGKKKLTVTWKKVSGASGYQIQYGTKKDFSKVTKKTVKKGTVKATLEGLKAKKTYYVRVRAYRKVNKKTYYSAWVKASQKTK